MAGGRRELQVFNGVYEVVEVDLERIPDDASFDAEAVVSVVSRGTELRVASGDTPFATNDFDFRHRRFKHWDTPDTVALGYQWVGRVVRTCEEGPSLGSLVNVFAPHGDRHRIALNGRWSEVPPGLPPAEACLLVSVQVALKSVHDSGLLPGERVVVIGAGVIGLLVARVLRACGYDTAVIGTRDAGLALASAAGAYTARVDRRAFDALAVLERVGMNDGPGADVVIDTSGSSDALDCALTMLRPHGRLVVTSFLGSAPAPLRLGAEFHHNALEIVSSQFDWGCGTGARRWTLDRLRENACRLLCEGIARGLITNRLDFADPSASYSMVARHPGVGYAFGYEADE